VSSTITGNAAGGEGGGIASYGGYLRITGSTISKNTATRTAGGIDNVYGTARISDSIITGNKAMYGAGIETYSGSSRLYIDGSRLSSNTATVYGGAVANISGYFKLNGSVVSGNKAGDRGGGVFASDAASFVNSGNSFSKNSASYGPNIFP
jgi:hypothetical protein